MDVKGLEDIVQALRSPLPDGMSMSVRGTQVFAIDQREQERLLESLGMDSYVEPARCFVCAIGKVAFDWGYFDMDNLLYASYGALVKEYPILGILVESPVEYVALPLRDVMSTLYELDFWSLDRIADWVESLIVNPVPRIMTTSPINDVLAALRAGYRISVAEDSVFVAKTLYLNNDGTYTVHFHSEIAPPHDVTTTTVSKAWLEFCACIYNRAINIHLGHKQ